jgi:hypothetical protein
VFASEVFTTGEVMRALSDFSSPADTGEQPPLNPTIMIAVSSKNSNFFIMPPFGVMLSAIDITLKPERRLGHHANTP